MMQQQRPGSCYCPRLSPRPYPCPCLRLRLCPFPHPFRRLLHNAVYLARSATDTTSFASPHAKKTHVGRARGRANEHKAHADCLSVVSFVSLPSLPDASADVLACTTSVGDGSGPCGLSLNPALHVPQWFSDVRPSCGASVPPAHTPAYGRHRL